MRIIIAAVLMASYAAPQGVRESPATGEKHTIQNSTSGFQDLTNSSMEPTLPRSSKSRTASFAGVVRSPQGAGLGGSRIALQPQSPKTGRGTALKRLATTAKGDGWFVLKDITPGKYTVIVTRDGYEDFRKENVSVRAGDEFVVEWKLVPVTSATTFSGLPHSAQEPSDLTSQRSEVIEESVIRRMTPDLIPSPEPMVEDDQVFTRVDKRWKYQYPRFRRYGGSGDFQFVKGHWYDPFNTNLLKGDSPILGNRIFLVLSATSDTFSEERRLPFAPLPASAPMGLSTTQYAGSQNFVVSADLLDGDAAYRPVDWRVRLALGTNLSYASVGKSGILNFTNRELTRFATQTGGMQEAFVEGKLMDLSDAYDTLSLRAGIQNFNSDFRGFIFAASAPGVRLFGNFASNRYQYNLAAFDTLVTDANSGLNLLKRRKQQVYIANLYRQDFLKRGYTVELSAHFDKDYASTATNANNFQVRPVPIGPSIPHAVRAYYLGFAGDGHLGRLNVSHAFYQALGHDTYNAIAARPVKINGRMSALEVSLDHDWVRYRAALFFASGDRNPRDGTARGFDSILPNIHFAGGIFSFWNREILNFSGAGVALTNGSGLAPDIRSGRTSGQANFVNPGLILANVGADLDFTPKLRVILNVNLIRFANTQPLQALLNVPNIRAGAGEDTGFGFRYRPALNDNVVFIVGFNTLFPGPGLHQIYSGGPFQSVFTEVLFRY